MKPVWIENLELDTQSKREDLWQKVESIKEDYELKDLIELHDWLMVQFDKMSKWKLGEFTLVIKNLNGEEVNYFEFTRSNPERTLPFHYSIGSNPIFNDLECYCQLANCIINVRKAISEKYLNWSELGL
jgi:hypothetical protein